MGCCFSKFSKSSESVIFNKDVLQLAQEGRDIELEGQDDVNIPAQATTEESSLPVSDDDLVTSYYFSVSLLGVHDCTCSVL